ncbi:hypothetical protein D3C87_2100860 [compost metagenome]
MMSDSVRRPLSRPETVMAMCWPSMRREKLLLVAGVQPSSDSSRTLTMISPAQCARRWGS